MPPELELQHRKLCAIKKVYLCRVHVSTCDKNQFHPLYVTPGYQGITEGMSYRTDNMARRYRGNPLTICFKPGTVKTTMTMVATIILPLFWIFVAGSSNRTLACTVVMQAHCLSIEIVYRFFSNLTCFYFLLIVNETFWFDTKHGNALERLCRIKYFTWS